MEQLCREPLPVRFLQPDVPVGLLQPDCGEDPRVEGKGKETGLSDPAAADSGHVKLIRVRKNKRQKDLLIYRILCISGHHNNGSIIEVSFKL